MVVYDICREPFEPLKLKISEALKKFSSQKVIDTKKFPEQEEIKETESSKIEEGKDHFEARGSAGTTDSKV